MKTSVIALAVSLMILPLCGSSVTLNHGNQDSVKIAVSDIRKANMIFLEHEHMTSLDSLYAKKIEAGKARLECSLKTDSLLREEIRSYARINTGLERKNEAWRKAGILSVALNAALVIVILL